MAAKETLQQSPGSAWVRVLCYLFGPLGAVLFLASRPFNRFWLVRFHAVHSILFFAFWLAVWSILELCESISTWFLATVLNEMQIAFNIGGLLMWAALMQAAHEGSRLEFLGPLHAFAARLASRLRPHRNAELTARRPHTSWKRRCRTGPATSRAAESSPPSHPASPEPAHAGCPQLPDEADGPVAHFRP